MAKARELSDNPNKITTKNALINGNFDFWQRGSSIGPGTGKRYLSDRWAVESNGTSYTISRQEFLLGQTDVPNSPDYFQRVVVTSVPGAGNSCQTYQRIENVKTFENETIILSFWAKADSNKNIAIDFGQNFGTGGSPSPNVEGLDVKTFSLTTSWQKFTMIATLPSLVGKTLGTNNDHHIGATIFFDAGSDFDFRTNSLGQQSGTFDIAQLQIEKGRIATDFELRPRVEELSLCLRYYEKSYLIDTTPGTPTEPGEIHTYSVINSGSNAVSFPISFKVIKRVPPTITGYSPNSGAVGNFWSPDNAPSDIAFAGFAAVGDAYCHTIGAFVTNPSRNYLHWTADAEL